MRTVVRFRQFQSATSDEKLATKYRRREDGKGFLWTIDIPAGFVGAREIAEVAWREREAVGSLFVYYNKGGLAGRRCEASRSMDRVPGSVPVRLAPSF